MHEKGIAPVVDAIEPGADVFVTIDLDGLDPSIMPAVYVPAPGGLMYWQVVRLVDAVVAKARLRAMAILELVPDNDPERLSALTAGRMPATRSGRFSAPDETSLRLATAPRADVPGRPHPGPRADLSFVARRASRLRGLPVPSCPGAENRPLPVARLGGRLRGRIHAAC